jgi:hypothetical protein
MDKLIRLKGSDKVYLLKGTKHWLKTAETLTGLGFNFGDEVEVDAEEFAEYEEGEPIEVVENEPVADLEFTEEEESEQPSSSPSGDAENDIAEPVKELWQ